MLQMADSLIKFELENQMIDLLQVRIEYVKIFTLRTHLQKWV